MTNKEQKTEYSRRRPFDILRALAAKEVRKPNTKHKKLNTKHQLKT